MDRTEDVESCCSLREKDETRWLSLKHRGNLGQPLITLEDCVEESLMVFRVNDIGYR